MTVLVRPEVSPRLEGALLTRVYSIDDPCDSPEYRTGLKEAVAIGLRYGFEGVRQAEGAHPQIPVELLAQARRAARTGVRLDTVLRRYYAGYVLIEDHLIGRAEEGTLDGAQLRRLLRRLASLFDSLVATISDEYGREAESRSQDFVQRRAEQVKMLLAGELVDPDALAYELEGWHVALIGTGPAAREKIRSLAASLDRQLLSVCVEEGAAWAWLGGRQAISSQCVLTEAEDLWSGPGALVIGEPGQGLEGWRLSHRQAEAALPLVRLGVSKVLRYTDFTLLTAALSEDILANSLREVYLAPLERSPDGGVNLRRTLEAYFETGHNTSSTAAALGISRQTVNSRLRAVEKRVGRPIDSCAAELETALRLKRLSEGSPE